MASTPELLLQNLTSPLPDHGSTSSNQLKMDNSSTQWPSAEHARLSQLWEEEIKNPARYVSYTKCAALLLSWEETDMNTDGEVRYRKYRCYIRSLTQSPAGQ
jgi:hypothetical protein